MALDRVAIYEKNLARIHEWIRSVDQKLSIFLALQGVYTVFISQLYISQLLTKYQNMHWLLVFIIILGYVLLIFGLAKCLRSLYATLRFKGEKLTEDQLSVTYFSHIFDTGKKNYEKKMAAMTEKKYLSELISQIYESAKIATSKHKNFNEAIVLFVLGGVLLIAGICWLYIV